MKKFDAKTLFIAIIVIHCIRFSFIRFHPMDNEGLFSQFQK